MINSTNTLVSQSSVADGNTTAGIASVQSKLIVDGLAIRGFVSSTIFKVTVAVEQHPLIVPVSLHTSYSKVTVPQVFATGV